MNQLSPVPPSRLWTGQPPQEEHSVVAEPEIKQTKIDELPHPGSDIHYIAYSGFQSLLQEAKGAKDPFIALTNLMTPREGHWTCFIELAPQVHVECQLAFDAWDSVCFGLERAGEYRFIEVFEHDKLNGITDEKQLICIRISQDHQEGEWLWINRGRGIPGCQSKVMAEEISQAMRIKTCYLADCAHVRSKTRERDIEIRLPLQVMGRGYYAPTFALVQTQEKILSNIDIRETDEKIMFNQNVNIHESELTWLRQLPVKTIHDEILQGRDSAQKEFVELLKRYNPNGKGEKRLHESVLNRCAWCFKKLLEVLYAKAKNHQPALVDYEWVYFNLLDTPDAHALSEIQQRYCSVIQQLLHNVLLSADFTK